MRSQSKRTGTQVFATTHSPTLLAWLTKKTARHLCLYRDAESGATKMRSLAEFQSSRIDSRNYSLDQLFEKAG